MWDCQLVGDTHTSSKAAIFSGRDKDGSINRYFSRLSVTASREFETYRELQSAIASTGLSVKIPKHNLLEANLLLRDYVRGVSLSELERYYIAGIECCILFSARRGFPDDLRQIVLSIIQSPQLKQSKFYERILEALRTWPRFLEWRNAVGSFLDVPLPGEALRFPLRLLYVLHSSAIRNHIQFVFDQTVFLEVFRHFIASKFETKSLIQIAAKLRSEIDSLSTLSNDYQLYDIHYGNLLLDEVGQLNLIDLECAGLGSSSRILADFPFFLKDLFTETHHLVDGRTSWSEKLPRGTAETPLVRLDKETRAITGNARFILCGTASFEGIIQTLRETVFFSVMFENFDDIGLDAHEDQDIEKMPDTWKYFQKLKRVVRGVSSCSIHPPKINQEVVNFIEHIHQYDVSTSSNNPLIDRANEIIGRLKRFEFERNSVEFYICMRIFEFIRFLPFEILLNQRIHRKDIEQALRGNFDGSREPDVLSGLVRNTLVDIFCFSIPYHTRHLNGVYQFPNGMRRRIERKILLSERRESNLASHWLNKMIEVAITSRQERSIA